MSGLAMIAHFFFLLCGSSLNLQTNANHITLLTFGLNSATAIVEPVLHTQIAATAGMQALADMKLSQ